MPDNSCQETFIRYVSAKIFAKAQGVGEEEGEEIVGHFLVKRQGARLVLWEVTEYSRGVAVRINSIGPISHDDYCLLVERNFR